jgi:hypothetical protein
VLQAIELAAQNGFEQGYLLRNSGDTLFGSIRDRKEGFRPKLLKKIEIRTNGKVQRFALKHVQEYAISGRTYERHWLKQSRSFPREVYQSIEGVGEQQFLRVVCRGKLSYFQLEFYDVESGALEFVDLFILAGETRMIRATQGVFGLKKNALSSYFSAYPQFVERINANEFKRAQELVDAFNAFAD